MYQAGRMMAKFKLNPEFTIGNVITILGGVITLITIAATMYSEAQSIKASQAKQADRIDAIDGRVRGVAESVARMEGRIEILLERRRASVE